jgi:hypothetical protein
MTDTMPASSNPRSKPPISVNRLPNLTVLISLPGQICPDAKGSPLRPLKMRLTAFEPCSWALATPIYAFLGIETVRVTFPQLLNVPHHDLGYVGA